MTIKERLLKIRADELKEFKRHEKKVKALSTLRVICQKECPHKSRTFESDPSGNNDSCYICDLCGKYL